MKQLKTTFSQLCMALILLSAIVSCSKVDVGPKKDPPPVHPTAPSLALDANIAWYNGEAKITVTTDAESVSCMGVALNGKTHTVYGVTRDSTLEFVAKNTAGAESAITKKFITVRSYGDTVTKFSNHGPVQLTYFMSCNVDSLRFPMAWYPGPADCDSYEYKPDGTGIMTEGLCRGINANQKWNVVWSWKGNGVITFGPNDQETYQLDSVSYSGYQISKVFVDQTHSNILYKTVMRYTTVQ